MFIGSNYDEVVVDFDAWIDSLGQTEKSYLDRQAIKELIMTASTKYGVKNANLNIYEVDSLYKKWFSEEDNFLDREEVVNRLKDMFEAEQHPIRECAECE